MERSETGEQIDPQQRTVGLRHEDGPSPGELSARRMAAASVRGHADESVPGTDDKELYREFPDLTDDVLARLAILETGTALEQGGTYLDLNDRARGPFKAIGGQVAEPGNRYVAKRDTDYELWNRIAGQHRPVEVERPSEA